MTNHRIVYPALVGVAALLAGVIVALLLVFGELRRQADEAAYQECMARYGYVADAPPNTAGGADEYIAGLADAAEACGR